jgi:uncharacterized protein (DUF58 family)
MLGSLANRIELVGAAWARKRQGADPPSGVTLKRGRIYILPTRYGGVFGLVIFAMLLGSINYGASLGFALTFLMAGLALVVMTHCHNNLLSLRLRFVGANPVFAGQAAKFRFSVTSDAAADRYAIELTLPKGRAAHPIDVPADETRSVEISVATRQRGWIQLDRYAVATEYPANLFRAWTWVHMPARCLVYPRPAPVARTVPLSIDSDEAGKELDKSDADFYGLRSAMPSDSPRRIAWKAYARSDELLAKQFMGGDPQPRLLDWDMLPGRPVEQRISQLTRWCLDAAEQSRSFGLKLPGKSLPIGTGHRHLHRCLKELALYEAPVAP